MAKLFTKVGGLKRDFASHRSERGKSPLSIEEVKSILMRNGSSFLLFLQPRNEL
jgi:hypothetical protein